MQRYLQAQNQANTDWPITDFRLVALQDLHMESGNIRNDISWDGNAEARVGLPIIAGIIMILACFNYINIAIVSATRRLKEIGLRKAIGARRAQIRFQFLAENILLTLLALCLGLMLAVSLFLPWFNGLTGDPMDLSLIDLQLWLFLLISLLITGFLSGIYPAFYVSRFDAVHIFKGTLKLGKKNLATKIFLGLQLIFTCAGITCAVIFVQNNKYQNSKSWGYNQHQALHARVPDYSGYQKLKAQLEGHPDVIELAGGEHHLGESSSSVILRLPGQEMEVQHFAVTGNYDQAMGLDLVQGRFHRKDFESDQNALVISELLVEKLQLDNPIGFNFRIDSIRFEVIGVVKDFHHNNFYYELVPTVFTLSDDAAIRHLAVKARSGKQVAVYETMRKEWSLLFPETPFQGGFQEDVWTRFFEQVDTAREFYLVIATIAVVLASLGLYGLVTFNVAGRSQEFSIRKALGAGKKNLTVNVGKPYAGLFFLSILVGIPFSYFMAKASLDMLYAYPMPISPGGLMLAVTILLSVLAAVLYSQIRKVVTINPTEGLKVE